MERVEFPLGFSKALLIIFLILHLGAILILLRLPTLFLYKVIGIAFLVMHNWKLLKLHVFRKNKNAIVKIWQEKSGRFGCKTYGGHLALGLLQNESYISMFFMIVRIQLKSGVKNVVIPFDALTPHQFRVLSTRLKFFS